MFRGPGVSEPRARSVQPRVLLAFPASGRLQACPGPGPGPGHWPWPWPWPWSWSWDDRQRPPDTLFSNLLANPLGNFAHKILRQNCADRPLYCKSVSLQIYLQQFTDKFTWLFHKTNSLAKLYLHVSLLQVYFTADLLTCRCIATGLR